MNRVAQEVVNLESPDEIALADRMKVGKDQIVGYISTPKVQTSRN